MPDYEEDIALMEEEFNWKAAITGLLMRAQDGEVSDDDVDFVLSILPGVDDNLQEWLQDLVDRLGQKNIELIMYLWMIYQMRSR